MAELQHDRLRALHADLAAGARQAGEPEPGPEDIRAMALLLRTAHEAPADLVPYLRAALAREALVQQRLPAIRRRQGLRPLFALLWAEARFLPLSFLVLQAALLAVGLLANRYLTGSAGSRALAGPPGTQPAYDLLARAVCRDALGRSADAITLLAPWLGMLTALFAVLPWCRGPWADLEALSPFSSGTRLLARAAVSTLIVAAATLGLGLWQRQGVTPSLLALARTAPLFLAVAWALAWALPFGAAGGVLASLLLWGGLTWWGGRLGRWDLFAPPAAGGAMLVQALALGGALALFALVRIEAGRGAVRVRGRG